MPTLQSPGIGSGLDVNGLVTQLVAAERTPGANRIAREKASISTEVSALGTLKGALSSFGATLDSLKTVEAFSARTAESADNDIFTATATTAAPPGAYDVVVDTLAQAHQIASTAFGSSSTTVGTGTLTIGAGTDTTTIAIDSTNSTLAGIRDAINQSSSKSGVRAAIVQAVDGSHLVLTSTKTGAANKITVEVTSSDGLDKVSYAPTNLVNYAQKVEAKDSKIFIAGFEHTSTSNVVSDAIDGVTLTLKKKPEDADPIALNVGANTGAANARIKNFVSQFNAALKQMFDLGKYDASNGSSGPLIGDALLRSVTSELRRGASDQIGGLSGNVTSLAQIGITTSKEGYLQVDDTKLSAALTSNFDAVGQLFGSANGVAARLSASVTKRLDATGELASRNKSLDTRSKSVVKRQTELDAHMAKIESIYRAQFTALDVALAKMQSTSTYLSQQLANLPTTGS